MRFRRLFAGVLAACVCAAVLIPARAQEASAYNVLYDADITYVGLDSPHYYGNLYQDIAYLVDNEWAIGPESQQGNYHARIDHAKTHRNNENGIASKSGAYAAVITFELAEAAQVAGFRLIHPDVTGAPGANDPLDFLLTHFDVLGSESGQPGTWKVLYEARDLRTGSDVEYSYWNGEPPTGIPFYTYEDKFTTEMTVSHIALAIHGLNVETNPFGEHMNIHEFQVFTPERYAVQEDTESVTTEPAPDPLTVEDFIPKTPLGMTAVSAVLATGCAAGCLAWNRKKEQAQRGGKHPFMKM